MKTYVTTMSEDLTERANQIKDYHPDLCYEFGKSHRAAGWVPIARADWDDDQTAAYMRAFDKKWLVNLK